ncbi:MAG: hypothetical protein J6T74_02825 [Clostridia bacterium]|nr:hypothetical protein [Clostridia bacterium]
MWSFVIIDTKDYKNIQEVIDFLNSNYANPDIIYCNIFNKSFDGVKNYIFNGDENTEAILNTVAKKCSGDHIVVFRKLEDYKKVLELTNDITKDNQVSYFSAEKNNLFGRIKRFIIKAVNFSFGQNIKIIDYGMVAYGKIASLTLKNAINPSITTRTNNFVGVNYNSHDGGLKYKFKYNKLNAVLSFVVPLLLFAGTIICRILIGANINVLLRILFVGLIILELFFTFLFGAVWFIKSQIGDNVSNKAKYK